MCSDTAAAEKNSFLCTVKNHMQLMSTWWQQRTKEEAASGYKSNLKSCVDDMYLVTQLTEQTEESRVFYQSEYFCLTIKDPESLQSKEEQQQHHIQNQIMRRVGK